MTTVVSGSTSATTGSIDAAGHRQPGDRAEPLPGAARDRRRHRRHRDGPGLGRRRSDPHRVLRSSACDPSGNGEGTRYLGYDGARPPPGLRRSRFHVHAPRALSGSDVLTATATSTAGTSEFSPCWPVSGGPGDPGDTPVGTNVVATPVDATTGESPVHVTFGTVTSAGVTSLRDLRHRAGPAGGLRPRSIPRPPSTSRRPPSSTGKSGSASATPGSRSSTRRWSGCITTTTGSPPGSMRRPRSTRVRRSSAARSPRCPRSRSSSLRRGSPRPRRRRSRSGRTVRSRSRRRGSCIRSCRWSEACRRRSRSIDHHDGTAVLGGTAATGAGGVYAISLNGQEAGLSVNQPFPLTVREAPAFMSPASTASRSARRHLPGDRREAIRCRPSPEAAACPRVSP